MVIVSTVDKLFFEKGKRVSYLKADLEGHELEMLEGAKIPSRGGRLKLPSPLIIEETTPK